MANNLSYSKKILILTLLTEGNSIRSIERIASVHRDTIMRLLVTAGNKAQEIIDTKLIHLKCNCIEVDEIWTYVGKKHKRVKSVKDKASGYGDQYVFVALDAETKLVPCFYLGRRTVESTLSFCYDLYGRVNNRFSTHN